MKAKILLSLLCLIAVVTAWSGQIDTLGRETAANAFSRALVTFAIARTLNGVISVAQGTEVAVEPAGVGVNFAPGQMLDPINDLVERFSSVMLVATSALGAQNILLRISEWWGVTAFLAVAAAAFVISLWLSPQSPWRDWAYRLMLIAFVTRFAVPLAVLGTSVVFDTFLETEYAAATAALQQASDEIREISQEDVTPPPPESFLGRIGSFIDESLESANVAEKMERFRAGMSDASEHIVNLIVVFVLQTIVIPIAFLWLLAQAFKRLLSLRDI